MSDRIWDCEVKTEVGGDFEIPPEGALAGRVCALIDVGHHDATGQDGGSYQRRTVILGFELSKKKKDGKPFILARSYTLSLAQNSSLYKIVKALSGEKKIGEAFDPTWVAGKPCLIQITHSTKTKRGKERTYGNIDSVGALPEEMKGPQGGCVVWSLKERVAKPLPDVSFLPPLYHESTGAMKTVAEWVNLSAEIQAEGNPVSGVADARMSKTNGPLTHPHERVQPVTQAEADAIDPNEVPF